MFDEIGAKPSIDLSLLGGSYSPVALIERERRVLGQIAAGMPLAEVLNDLLLAVEAQSQDMMASVLFLSEDGQYMLHGAAPSLPAAYNEAIHGIAIGEGIGSCGTAAARGTPVYVQDIATSPLWDGFADLAVPHGLRACWSMPITAADGKILGTFAVYYGEPRAPMPSDIEAIALIAQTAALAIERHRSDQRLRRSQDALRDLNSELERKVNERATERSRTWLLSNDLLSVINDQGVIEASNPAWTITLGWAPEELLTTFMSFVHPDDVRASEAVFTQAANGRPVSRFQNRFRHRNGHYRWLAWVAVLEDGKVYCSGRDITLEKEQANSLAIRTRERDRAWGLSQELLVIASPNGTLDEVNARWTEQLGWTERELVGTTFSDYTHPDDLMPALAAFSGIFEAPLIVPYEYRLRHKDGSYKWFSWTGTFEDGRVYAAGRHVTVEREQAEALRQSQKMEAVGQLTGGVAHDFNNLMTVIRSSTDLLLRPGLDEARRIRYVTAISETVDRAAKLTGQLLAFARRQTLKPEVFSVCNNVRAISGMMGTLTGSRIELISELADAPCLVNADPSQFDTALVNMVANARDAMRGEGRLTLAVRPVESMPSVRLHPALDGPFVAISITDTGTGIPATQLEKIFEPFYTTKNVGEGTGLGLSQVFGFAKQSGGEISVASELGRGTTFTLYLPRVTGSVEEAEPDAPPLPLEDGHGTCVLVVEDNGDVGTFAVQALAELGYKTVLAANAQEALSELDKDASRFDVVFSDVVMPGMSGIELAHAIRARFAMLPVVLTSGFSHVLARSGTDGFELLHKPYSIDQLSRMLLKVSARNQ
ncbi:PAS domain-containing protein [Pseudomonas sp. NFR16]|uniref:PAS domain-containing protein n=1 Tax=Pseudomonas sp. NFR16 TaxID=1566248 RepID=UPI0008C4762C|nr:PAS domain-containing protein [Pseudomonas sp. NFR16]SEI53740.1 PAS domain S-box-containing protein [Pseudomonas sp. NFR16]